MGEQWPDGGPWVVVPTSAEVDWEAAVAALTAAASVRVAAVAIGGSGGPVRASVATWTELRDTDPDPLTLAETCDLVAVLARTHGLVLVAGVPGLLVPVGRAGWTMTDLAARLGAPVVVVTGDGPDAANHTTLALDALTTRGLAGTVVTVGGPPPGDARPEFGSPPAVPAPAESAGSGRAASVTPPVVPDPARSNPAESAGSGQAVAATPPAATPPAVPEAPAGGPAMAEDLPVTSHPPADTDGPRARAGSPEPADSPELAERLPVTPAGRIPAGVGVPGREAARGFLDPILHASTGRAAAPAPAPAAAPAGPPVPVTGGTRVALALIALFVTMSLAAVGLAFCDRPDERPQVTAETSVAPRWRDTPPPAPTPSFTGVPVTRFCPVDALPGPPTRPSPRVTDRVDAAWERIEKWLAAKAPESHASLRPGAGVADIDAAQRRMSVPFPPDLVASLLRHNGTGNGVAGFPLPFMHPPMTVAETVDAWQSLCETAATYHTPGDASWWDNEYVPFARAGDGGYLLVDQRKPAVTGRVVEFYDEDGVRFSGWPSSVADLLEQVATALETGEPFAGRYRPALAGDRLEWIIR